MPVLCMYLNHKEHDTQNPRTLIGSLLKQIVQYNDYDFCSEDLVRKYKGKAKGTSLSRKELQEAFCSEIMHYERCVETTGVDNLLRLFQGLRGSGCFGRVL